MDAKDRLLGNINSNFTQETSFNSVEEAIVKVPETVLIELVDMVCLICDRLEEAKP